MKIFISVIIAFLSISHINGQELSKKETTAAILVALGNQNIEEASLYFNDNSDELNVRLSAISDKMIMLNSSSEQVTHTKIKTTQIEKHICSFLNEGQVTFKVVVLYKNNGGKASSIESSLPKFNEMSLPLPGGER